LQYDHQNEKAFRILTELRRNPYFNKLPILEITFQKYVDRMGTKEDPK